MEAGKAKNSAFRKRTIISLIGVPIVAALVWLGTPWLTMFAVVWGVLAANEFYVIVGRSKGLAPLTYFGLIWVALFIISPHQPVFPPWLSVFFNIPFLLVTAVILPLVILLGRSGKENAFANWTWTVGGILYIGFLMRYFIELREVDSGMGWVFLAILCTFASDICAYLSGRAFGRRKMAPYISPNKTWEGAAGGVLGAVVVSIAVVKLLGIAINGEPLGYGYAVVLGILISAIGQAGDMVKSLFKRNMMVKDSGQAIPGHGGFLDRMDSMAFAGVGVYYFYYFMTSF